MTQRGFSLLEVLAAIGIVIVISLFSLPAIRGSQKSSNLRTEARNLLTSLRLAQQRTLAEQTTYLVQLTTTSPQGWRTIRRSATDTTIEQHTLTSDVSWQSTGGFTDNEIIFNTTGAVNQAGTITLLNSANQTMTVNVKPSGYVRVN